MPKVKIPKRLQQLADELDLDLEEQTEFTAVDECEKLFNGDVANLLAESRKFGIRLMLCPQNLGRLDLETATLEDGDDA